MSSRKQVRQAESNRFASPFRHMESASSLLATGLVFALIGFLAVATNADNLAALLNLRSPTHTEIPSAPLLPFSPHVETRLGPCPHPPPQQGIPCAAAADSPPLPVTVTQPAVARAMRGGRGGHDGSREFLQDAAAAMRNPGVRPQGRETRTDLWINAPGMVGNTSPPEASPAPSPPAR